MVKHPQPQQNPIGFHCSNNQSTNWQNQITWKWRNQRWNNKKAGGGGVPPAMENGIQAKNGKMTTTVGLVGMTSNIPVWPVYTSKTQKNTGQNSNKYHEWIHQQLTPQTMKRLEAWQNNWNIIARIINNRRETINNRLQCHSLSNR